jgi:transposase
MSDKKAMWQARVAEWRASGKTAEEFSTDQGFAAGTLRWWSSRLRRDTRPRAATPSIRIARMVRSSATAISMATPRQASGVVIELLDARARVLVDAGVDRETLGMVLAVMRAGGER